MSDQKCVTVTDGTSALVVLGDKMTVASPHGAGGITLTPEVREALSGVCDVDNAAIAKDLADLLGVSVEGLDLVKRWGTIHGRIRALVETVELYERDWEWPMIGALERTLETGLADAGRPLLVSVSPLTLDVVVSRGKQSDVEMVTAMLADLLPAGVEANVRSIRPPVDAVSSDPAFVLERGDLVRFEGEEEEVKGWAALTIGEIHVDADEVFRNGRLVWKREA